MTTLFKLAAFATIIGTVIMLWQLFDRRGNTSTEATSVKTQLEKEKSTVDLRIDLPVYQGERRWLLAMFQAAKSIPDYDRRDNALKNVVRSSIQISDLNMAIIAAKAVSGYDGRGEILNEVVNAAIQSKDSVGYAVVAAESIPSYDSKTLALEKIVAAFGRFARENADADKMREPGAVIRLLKDAI